MMSIVMLIVLELTGGHLLGVSLPDTAFSSCRNLSHKLWSINIPGVFVPSSPAPTSNDPTPVWGCGPVLVQICLEKENSTVIWLKKKYNIFWVCAVGGRGIVNFIIWTSLKWHPYRQNGMEFILCSWLDFKNSETIVTSVIGTPGLFLQMVPQLLALPCV